MILRYSIKWEKSCFRKYKTTAPQVSLTAFKAKTTNLIAKGMITSQ
jgi:hypothetical protein